MKMKLFEAKGNYSKKGTEHKFSKFVLAEDKEKAQEKILSLLGAQQKLTRKNITIEEMKEAK